MIVVESISADFIDGRHEMDDFVDVINVSCVNSEVQIGFKEVVCICKGLLWCVGIGILFNFVSSGKDVEDMWFLEVFLDFFPLSIEMLYS